MSGIRLWACRRISWALAYMESRFAHWRWKFRTWSGLNEQPFHDSLAQFHAWNPPVIRDDPTFEAAFDRFSEEDIPPIPRGGASGPTETI